MQIRPLQIDDDAQVRAAYGVVVRAVHVGREDAPRWSFDDFAGQLRTPDSGERSEPFVGLVDDAVAGYGVLHSFLLDNTDKAWLEVRVDPGHRRRGHGRRLLEHLVRLAEADGRSVLLADAKVPIDQVDTHPNVRFLTEHGFTRSNIEVVRYQKLPVPEAQLQAWADSVAAHHADYRIETFVDHMPEELVPGLCTLLGQLAVDAPTGAVDFEEETMTPQRFAEWRATIRAMGRSAIETLAIAPDGTVAAQTTLSVPLDPDDPDAMQWGTFVHREHRGRRLGLAVKVANLRVLQRSHPHKQRVMTQNAETNDYMVSINELMGFEVAEASVELVRRS